MPYYVLHCFWNWKSLSPGWSVTIEFGPKSIVTSVGPDTEVNLSAKFWCTLICCWVNSVNMTWPNVSNLQSQLEGRVKLLSVPFPDPIVTYLKKRSLISFLNNSMKCQSSVKKMYTVAFGNMTLENTYAQLTYRLCSITLGSAISDISTLVNSDLNHFMIILSMSSPQGSSWTRMVVVPLLWLRQQLGIHCRMNCETRISTVPTSDTTWRRFCFNNTGCTERIRGAVRLCAI